MGFPLTPEIIVVPKCSNTVNTANKSPSRDCGIIRDRSQRLHGSFPEQRKSRPSVAAVGLSCYPDNSVDFRVS